MYRQYTLTSGGTTKVGWIDADPPLKTGWQVTLKNTEDPARRWTVVDVGTVAMGRGPSQEWQVGGITTRKLRGR